MTASKSLPRNLVYRKKSWQLINSFKKIYQNKWADFVLLIQLKIVHWYKKICEKTPICGSVWAKTCPTTEEAIREPILATLIGAADQKRPFLNKWLLFLLIENDNCNKIPQDKKLLRFLSALIYGSNIAKEKVVYLKYWEENVKQFNEIHFWDFSLQDLSPPPSPHNKVMIGF